ncbi:MAG: sigma-70 family RNA polymerase sigma factor [Planctomycetota bacterium]|jgi:RNA polymerase sigma-70 factor (ECF subfamily)
MADVDPEELALLQSGDSEQIAEVFSRYQDRLQRMIRFRLDRRLYGRVDSADVLQEVWLDASKRVSEFAANPTVPFFVWLRQIAWQTIIDLHRKHLGAKKRSVANEVAFGGGQADTSLSIAARLAGDLTSPSQAAMRDERMAQLRQALEEMDEIDREVLALRHFEELGNNEVAEILGLQKTAASNRYIRALKRLKEVLEQFPDLTG